MEYRNITLTLDKAKEFYNSDNEALREIALQAFTEDELENKDFQKFKSWKDIETDFASNGISFYYETKTMYKGQFALFKLNIIRRILNKNQKMSLIEGDIWYPQIRFVTKQSKHYNDKFKMGNMVKVGTIKQNCEEYFDVLSVNVCRCGADGLGFFYNDIGVGMSSANPGFLGCATREIAEHMSRYFAKEIFDAMYGDFVDYEWV